MPKLNGVSENILYLIALAKGKFVGAFQKCLHIEALEKAKPCSYFQDIPPKNSSLLAIDEDVFFEALNFGCSQGY